MAHSTFLFEETGNVAGTIINTNLVGESQADAVRKDPIQLLANNGAPINHENDTFIKYEIMGGFKNITQVARITTHSKGYPLESRWLVVSVHMGGDPTPMEILSQLNTVLTRI